MVERGVGSWQVSRARTAVQVVMKILKDGEWHRYQELREKTGLSSATLSKHLKELEKGVVEKEIRLESGEYPYPVFYRIKEQYQTLFKVFNIPDARKLGRNTKVDKKKLEEEMQAYLESITQALSRSVNGALSIYASDGNVEAFRQSAGTALALYNEALQAVKNKIDRYEEANRKARAPLEESYRISEEVSSKLDEVHKGEQDKTHAKTKKRRNKLNE